MDTKPPNSTPKRKFFQRHNQWITFFGATLVLITYLVKDEWRERAKDAADAADNNIQVVTIERKVDSLRALVTNITDSEELDRMGQRQSTITDVNPGDSTTRPSGPPPFNEQLTALEVEQSELGEDDTNIENVMEPFFDGKYSHDLSQAVNAPSSTALTDEGKAIALYSMSHTLSKECQDELNEVDKALLAWRQIHANIEIAFLNALQNDKKDKEGWYDWYRVASYYLYGIGWGMALLGRIYGVKGLSDEE